MVLEAIIPMVPLNIFKKNTKKTSLTEEDPADLFLQQVKKMLGDADKRKRRKAKEEQEKKEKLKEEQEKLKEEQEKLKEEQEIQDNEENSEGLNNGHSDDNLNSK